MEDKVSALIIVYNEEKLIERCLKSLKNAVDEIFVIHDGACSDNTIKICKKYTKRIFIRPHKGRASLHMIFAFKNIKNKWILKIDADEFLSKPLQKNLKKLIQNKKADAYAFLWRWWDGEKYITKNFPHKMVLFKKSKISFLEFPGNDEPEVLGKILKSDLSLEHKPKYNNFSWKNLMKRGLKRARDQAEYTLKDFDELEKFQYHREDFKNTVKFRRKFPISSMLVFPLLAFFRILLKENAWKEGEPVFKFALSDIIYQAQVSYLIYKLKQRK
jgi:glycosyltransferase involved in cell wall biosynthesis